MIYLQVAEPSNEFIIPLIVGTGVSIFFAIMAWSLTRNIAANDVAIKENAERHDKSIKEQEAIINRLRDELDRMKEKINENHSNANAKIYEMTAEISKGLNELSVKIAEMKRNDLNPK